MKNKISKKDKKDWENFLSDNEKLPNKDFELSKKRITKTKRIDLHGFTLEEANKTIEKIINELGLKSCANTKVIGTSDNILHRLSHMYIRAVVRSETRHCIDDLFPGVSYPFRATKNTTVIPFYIIKYCIYM